jgi:AraC family transcriptional regulator
MVRNLDSHGIISAFAKNIHRTLGGMKSFNPRLRNALWQVGTIKQNPVTRPLNRDSQAHVRFLPAGEAHENYFPVESRCLHIELRQSILDLASEHGTTISAPGQVTGVDSTALGERLHREIQHKDSDSLLEIEGAILRLLLADERDEMHVGQIPHWLSQIREMRHDESNRRPSLIDLSRHAGRHPVQISRQFHQRFGCTLSEYTRRIRVARAQSLLSRLDLEISDIALACGFCDQSHFSTVFRRVTGMPPGQYRLLISGNRPPGSPLCGR